MTKTLKELALAAKEVSGDFTVDELCQYLLDGMLKERKLLERVYETFVQSLNTDINEIYARYAEGIGTIGLTDEQKAQAMLEHVLEKYADD